MLLLAVVYVLGVAAVRAGDDLVVYDPFDSNQLDHTEAKGMCLARIYDKKIENGNFGWNRQSPDSSKFFWNNKRPLSYPGLVSTPGYITNLGVAAGHFINAVACPELAASGGDDGGSFSAFGKPGTSVWVSLLVRPESETMQDRLDFGMNMAVVSWYDEAPMFFGYSKGDYKRFGVGAFGKHSEKNGKQYWTVAGENAEKKADYSVSDKPVEPLKTALIVYRIDYRKGEGDVSLYINPAKLGGFAPTKPDATITFIGNQVMSNFSWNLSAPVSIDELRIGKTFAAVTPTSSVSVGQHSDQDTQL